MYFKKKALNVCAAFLCCNVSLTLSEITGQGDAFWTYLGPLTGKACWEEQKEGR
jgi:hypothetical protein